jgi:carbamoyl-phosphate synthase small subunit
MDTGRCFVTSQNHGYAVDLASSGGTEWEPWFENLNDGTNEGLRSRSRPIRSVQFHPEGRPGPLDTEFLFDDFLKLTAELRGAAAVRV